MDARYFYSFYLQVRPVFPFQDLENDLFTLCEIEGNKGNILKACIVKDHNDKVHMIVIGGSPKKWLNLNASVRVIDSVLADNLIDMFTLSAEYIKIYEKEGKKL